MIKTEQITFSGTDFIYTHYISTIDGNVWSPTSYPQGWEEVA